MTVSLKHQFVSNVADSPDATLVQPSNWNAEHTLTANANSLLGAVTAGNVTEITCTSAGRALLDDADASAQRTTLGLGTISTQNSNNVSITGGSVTGITDIAVADGGTGASDAPTARTNLGIGTIATQNANNVSITGGSITGITDLAVADGGTGASDAGTARTNLGLGSIATQNANNVSITGGSITGITDLAVADGGTGASDATTARTNLGLGTISTQNANNVSITGGSITGITDLAVADGGTGASDAATARTNLGIGTLGTQNANAVAITGGTIVANASGISIRDADASNVMTIAVGSNLTANTTLTLTTGATTNRTLDISATNVTVSVAGAALIDDADAAAQRTTLGLGTIATQNANNVSITGGSITGITDLAVADGGTGASDAATARTNLGIGTIATQNANNVSITGGSITGITDLAVADGGTGASDAATARTNLGIGTIATQNANNVSITGGSITGITDLAIADGGTGASDAATARTNLGIGTIATQNANNVSITGGSITGITDLAVADGGTGASDAATARTNLGIGTMGTQNANAVAITGGTIVANASGISIRDADASNVMTIAVGSNLTANTTLTLTTGATTNRTLDISATNVTISTAGAALIDDADAAAQRTTLGLGTIATQNANAVSITGGSITGITDLAVADGGTGASDAATARTNLGIGTLGTQNANAVAITGGTIVANASGISIRDADASNVMTIAVGSNLTANTTLTLTTGATTSRTLDISATNVTVSVAGAALIDDADAAAQRTTLGLGTIATQNANNVSITGGSITGITDLAVADGGTGASDAATARTNLGIGTIATQNANNVSITGGSITGITDLAVADGGTGASTAAAAATNLGLGTTDSPQFAAVNVGNATDTTITRVSAGVIAVEGKTVVTETGGQTVQFAAGTNTAPSITATGDTNTGIYFPAADTIAFTEGGAEAMRIDSSGNVGIGTSSPGGRLDTSGADDTIVLFRNTTAIVRVRPYVTSYATSQIAALNAAASAYTPLAVGGSITTLETGGVERMRIGDSGQLGIGGANYGTSGQVLTSGGASAAPSWAAAPVSLVSLGTATAASGSSASITGLTLTNYRFILVNYASISSNQNSDIVQVSGDNTTAGSTPRIALSATAANSQWGSIMFELDYGGNLVNSGSTASAPNKINSSSTAIYFRLTGGVYDNASGVFKVYGLRV